MKVSQEDADMVLNIGSKELGKTVRDDFPRWGPPLLCGYPYGWVSRG